MEESMPKLYKELDDIRNKLEKHYKDMQHNTLFNINKYNFFNKEVVKKLIKLQLKLLLIKEGIIDKKKAITFIDTKSINQLLHLQIDPKVSKEVIIRGLPTSPDAACGIIIFNY